MIQATNHRVSHQVKPFETFKIESVHQHRKGGEKKADDTQRKEKAEKEKAKDMAKNKKDKVAGIP